MSENHPPLPPVVFNHLYVVLDDKTYRAIVASDFLRVAFPGVERRTTHTAAGETWSGAYFYGQDNYLEFFGSGSSPISGTPTQSGHWEPGAQEGWAGLAFSTDTPGGAAQVLQALRDTFHYEPSNELRGLQAGERTIHWFTTLKLAERLGLGSFDAWLMEYHPEIFAHKNIPIPESGKLTTAAYLSQWNTRTAPPPAEPVKHPTAVRGGRHASLSKEQPDRKKLPTPPPVFTRVIAATLHLDERRAERLAEVLELLGYARATEDDALVLAAHGFTLRIRPEETAPSGYRLSTLRLSLARPSVAPMTFVFAAHSRLTLNEDLTADWFFGV